MHLNKNLVLLSGDASFRKFYRKKKSVVIYSSKEKKINLLIYDAINKTFIKNKIIAPKLLKQNYKKNFIEVQDFGNSTIFDLIKKRKNRLIYYKKIISLLCKIQKIKNRKVNTFLNSTYKIPVYTKNKLLNEAYLFLKWYLPMKKNKKKQEKIKKEFLNVFENLLKKVKGNNITFVHRDFHVSNLMKFKNNIAVIDSQDAVYGNNAYDLASLIDDVRIKTSLIEKKKIFSFYLMKNKKIDVSNFENDFKILSVLRNFKIIGIFTRLSIRDNKHKYLKFIPYAWRLIKLRTNNDPNFNDLNKLLSKYFSKQINI